MPIKDMDLFHNRLREEIKAAGYSIAEASRQMKESSPQRLNDVVNGRQKIPTEMLASAANIGVDILYVVTGKHRDTEDSLSEDELALIEHYRALKESDKQAIYQVSETMASYKVDKKS